MGARVAGDGAAAGFAALDRGDWLAATTEFEAALAREAIPDALDGLGQATSTTAVTRVRCGARRGRPVSTSPCTATSRPQEARSAEPTRSLEKADPCAAGGWLAIVKGQMTTDAAAMRVLAASATDAGARFDDHDLEIVGMSLLGLADVYASDVASGMARLDEAMATASGGELSTFWSTSTATRWSRVSAPATSSTLSNGVALSTTSPNVAMPLFPFCHAT